MSNPLFAFRRDDDFSFGGAARGLPPGVHLEFYGGGKGGSSTQTVSIPPEVLARYNAVNARAENVAQTPFTPYSTDPDAFVAGLTSSQQAGIGNINAQQGAANQAVGTGQDLQMRGINTAQIGQAQANAINQAALQGISQAQQQGTAYNQAAGRNIGNAMNSAAPYMQQNAALQNQGLAQQQSYQRAATQNIGNAMSSAAPYMQQMAGLTQAGLGQGQQYLGGATDLTQQAIQTGQQYANKAEPYYTGALQAGQPLNQQAQQYMQAGTQAVNPNALDYGQYMNPYMSDVVQAQQALQAQENAQQRSALQGKAIQSGAFGGDRAGIEQANLARQQSLANQATMANLLQSGYGQAQAAAQQQQGVGLGAAQANRAAQQAAAQQAAALGQQQYAQQLGVGTGLSALGQQQYGQALGTGSQLGTLGQQGYTQNLGAGAQLGQVGQNLYNQNIGQGQAMANLGQQGLAAMQGTGTNLGNIGQQLFGQNIAQGQAIQGLGNQQFTQGLQGSQAASGIGQNIFGNAAQTAGIQQAGGMNTANLGLQNQAAQIAGAQAQMAAGQQQQQTEQAGKTALYNQFLQQQGYPFQIAQFLANIAMGTGALSGSTTSAARTGQRGGRMGDGYASGGLVPDSQGGAVYEPGMYERGGYASGGKMGPDFALGSDQDGNEVWTNLATGRPINQFDDPEFLAWRANGNVPVGNKKTAPKTGSTGLAGTSNYDQIVRNAYEQIGRKDFGTAASNIDEGGYNDWMNRLNSGTITPDQFNAQFMKEAQAYNAANPKSDVAKLTQPAVQSNADYYSVRGVDPDIADAFKEAVGRDIDGASARKYQAMMDAGLSLDQITYNIANSQPAKLKAGDVDALKGTPLTYDASKFSQPVAPVRNQYGAFSAGDFTPGPINLFGQQPGYGQPQGGGYGGYGGYGQPQGGGYGGGYGQPQGGGYSGGYGDAVPYGGYGNMSAIQGGYGGYGGGFGGYGGGMMGGYGQPSNYGMPNFGSSPQYGGAPDYAGAMQYGGMQAQYGMPQGYGMPQQNYGMPPQYQQPTQYGGYDQQYGQQQQYGMYGQQQAPEAAGKGAQPAPQQQAPQASGKGASQAPQATGKGASGMAGGGRAGFADGGRAEYARGGDPSSVLRGLISQYDPGDPQGLVAKQAAMFPGVAPKRELEIGQPTGARSLVHTPQRSILPTQTSGIDQAMKIGQVAGMGHSVWADLSKKPDPNKPDQSFSEKLGNVKENIFGKFGSGTTDPSVQKADMGIYDPDLPIPSAAGGRRGYALQGGIPYSQGAEQDKDPMRVGYMGALDLQQPIDPVQAFNAQKAGQMPNTHQASNPLVQGIQAANALNSGSKALKGAADFLGIGKTAPDMGSLANAPLPMARPEGLGAAAPEMGSLSSAPLPMARPEGLGALVSEGGGAAAAPVAEAGITEAAASPILGEMIGAGAIPAAAEGASLAALGEGAAAMGTELFAGLAAGAGSALEFLPFLFLKTGGRVGKAGGGGLTPQAPMIDMKDPDYHKMEASFDNLIRRYDGNPLLAAAAMDVGMKSVDKALADAERTGRDVLDFLPRRTKEYMYALSQAAMGAHKALSAPASKQVSRATGGRTGYAFGSDVEENTGLVPKKLASQTMTGADLEGTIENPPETKVAELTPNQPETTIVQRGDKIKPVPDAAPETSAPVPGLGAGRTSSTISGPSSPFVETVGKHLPDAVPTDSKFWVPLIAGLGSMLASNQYRFSQRLGEGLVGGTAAYAKMAEQEMGLKKSEQETEAQRLANQMKPFLFTPYGNVVFLKDGRMMLQGDYDAAIRSGQKLETMAAPAGAADYAAQFAEEQMKKRGRAGASSTNKPEAPKPEAPKPEVPKPAPAPAPIKPSSIIETKEPPPPSQEKLPEQKKVQPSYDDVSKKLAEEERIVAVNGGAAATTAKNISDKYVAAVAPMATAARDSNRYLGELASNLAEATKGKGLDAPGFGYSGRAQFVGALNTMSRAFGGKGDFGEADKIDQINKKIEALQSSIAAAGGGQESYAALNMLRNAMAGPSMSPRAYSQLAADLMVTNQRAIDRDLHMSKYRADSNGLLSNAAQDFERTHDSAMYNNEAESIKKMILKAPDLIKDLRSGKYTSDQIDKVFEKQGLRNMSRYFVGRS